MIIVVCAACYSPLKFIPCPLAMKSMHVKKTAKRIFLPMEHLGVYLLKHVCMFQIELEFGNVGFLGEGKTRVPGEKRLGAKERTNNKLKSHGVNAKTSTWATTVGGGGAGESALTTAGPLLRQYSLEYGCCYTILSLVTIYMHC